ncbi:ecdysteroid-phosphate phosphatase [Microplitis mediator]|uniref:ecdysteroid-phosphate phosphatase n=1 Tax=Microplitis mediator TaxID=375433 RepID=UPI0025569E6E|nr:ecdysteroid-phosphate phosphatase [Microplitis mediator]
MTTPPPRKSQTPTKTARRQLTPLEIMLKLGLSKLRSEKALAATGHRGAESATRWLLKHVQDPYLDADNPREYILYACPTGHLADKLNKFWGDSKELEWNKAHDYMPHITLLRFFKVPDKNAEQVSTALETLLEAGESMDRVDLETYVSPNFMGLFINEQQASFLESVVGRYISRLAGLGIAVEADTKSMHVSLAYEFSSSHFQLLRSMIEKINLSSSNWELRLYSREPRHRTSRVHKVVQAYAPRNNDELELGPGDFIYLKEDCSTDGWVEGVSYLTGVSGYLPLNYTKRTAITDTWTLHKTVVIPTSTTATAATIPESVSPRCRKPIFLSESVDLVDGIPADSEPVEGSPAASLRQIYICRHGERVDFTFGAWIPYCFEADGCYIRRDLNMPEKIPLRNIQDYQNDSPLTTVGEMQANLTGEAMKSSNVKIDLAFASPSLRCVQTLSQILKGLGSSVEIKVEPGLIEWLAWYPNGLPTWMTGDELITAGFNIDRNYQPIIAIDQLPGKENAAQYYERSYGLIKKIIAGTVGNVLIVAHAASLAACTRQLTGGRVPSAAEVTRLVQRVPYLACLTACEEIDGWQLHPPPFPPITHTSNSRFDWKIIV